MLRILGLVYFAALLNFASASWFGPPQFVQDACKKWCAAASTSTKAADACKACNGGPQTNPICKDKNCDYCEREIVFPRQYPELWRDEPSFKGKMAALEGKTRCWCETGCPVYKVKSYLFCNSECAKVCAGNPDVVV
mmetsp:Transcript_91874/g.145290  ORF Transcript_91874/g.145290 Transcript_91874/m.145290 type:complete len:137 (-) Transcript_91874:98-508(-)